MKQASESSSPKASIDTEVWENLAIAMLSVGGFSVQKVLELRGSLVSSGLFDPRNLAAWDEARITRDLTAAGYERGMLTGMYAERLSKTMRVLAAGERFAEAQVTLRSGDDEQVSRLLLPQMGIGPKVVENFLILRRSKKSR